jgi:O-antigen/teichoic acid export membrane protein
VLRNVGSNWVLIVLNVLLSYVTTPLVVHLLGDEGYGTWTLVTAITGYLSLISLGVPMALVRFVGQYLSLNDWPKTNQTIGTCAGLYLFLAGAALLIGAALWGMFLFYDIPSSYRADAYTAFALMVVHMSLSFAALLPEGILFAHHDFVPRNLVRVITLLLRFALILWVLPLRPSLTFLAVIQLCGLAFDFIASWVLVRLRYRYVKLDLRLFDWRMMRQILSFGLFVLLMAAGGRLTFETYAIIIGAVMGVGLIPYYAIANSLVVYLVEFVIAIAAVVAPMATSLSTQNRIEELREIFLKWSKASLSLTFAAGLFLVVIGPPFVGWWISPEYEQPSNVVLQMLVGSCFVFLPARGVALPILMGLGKPRIPTIAFLVAGLLNFVMSALLARPFGLAGVALGTAVPNVLFAIVVIAVACRELKVGLLEYVQYVVPRATLGALPMLALLVWFKTELGVSSPIGFIVAGAAMAVVFGLVWILFVYRDDPYVDVRTPLGRLRAWSRA